MAVYSNTAMGLYVDGFALEGFASQAELSVDVDEIDVTTIGSAGWRTKIPGLAGQKVSVTGFQDFALTGVDVSLPGTSTGQNVVTFAPVAASVADPAFMMAGRTTTRTSLTGQVGAAAGFVFDFVGDGRVVRGQNLHPSAARTATGNGTTTTFTTPTASQSLWASFHVFAASGTTPSVTFTIQTDDNAGMTTPTTRITSNAFTTTGSQFTSAVGPMATETHIRVVYTITGTTPSFTFAVFAGTN
jgi:hypothetical protein